MKPRNLVLLGLAIAALSAVPARANLTITAGNMGSLTDENILFEQTGTINTGLMVNGFTQQSNLLVDFSGAGETLQTYASGQARVAATDGEFSTLNIGLDNPAGHFDSLIFNLNTVGAGTVNFTVTPVSGAAMTAAFPVGAGGQNYFTFQAGGGQSMRSVSLTTSPTTASDIRQVRIGGAAIGDTTSVPEPGSLALLGTGLLPLVGFIRRKR